MAIKHSLEADTEYVQNKKTVTEFSSSNSIASCENTKDEYKNSITNTEVQQSEYTESINPNSDFNTKNANTLQDSIQDTKKDEITLEKNIDSIEVPNKVESIPLPNTTAVSVPSIQKNNTNTSQLTGYEFFNSILKSSKLFLAPMVDQSELAWRILSRKYGAQVCFTPMFHAKMFSNKENRGYFNEMWQTNEQDRPLIVQFCANDPEHFLEAAKLVEDHADAVDINLGCPQHIAKRGKYGAFLMDEWDLIYKIVNTASKNLKIPVTAKIRVYKDLDKTIEYAKMLERAGAKILTVHGRLAEQKGHKTGLVDWSKIKAIKESVNIPVISNGGILYREDVLSCLKETKADGVMVAETSLYNPIIFDNSLSADESIPPSNNSCVNGLVKNFDIANEYLDIIKGGVETKISYVRSHLFKIFKPSLPNYPDLRSELAASKSIEDFSNVVDKLKLAMQPEIESSKFDPYNIEIDEFGYKIIPHWYCQPSIRKEYNKVTSSGDKPLGRNVVNAE
ncbi:tRNA-dihydrouridine(16/17) synthase [NAD(P)(+)]-like [Smittium culicis]|uniref:tRNA-dihydrouridine(16/17) synthase [NAD(P)(+)] n=1 Tax=Smittium culicis TaxID=133412 RepID=A0A1R1XTS0_9FUNG|nr:tRNA-dihydrouridine(16/17) synthase [NAD(P)(+)]-like [Smittium culicis]